MKNKALKTIFSLFFIAAVITLYLLCANVDYLFASKSKGNIVLNEQIEYVNWQKDKETMHAAEDPQIIFRNLDRYVEKIQLTGILNGEISPQIFFTTAYNEPFTEENSFMPEYSENSGIIIFDIDKHIYDLRIDLTDDLPLDYSLEKATIFPTVWHCDYFALAACILFACILLVPLYYPASKWGNLNAYLADFKKYTYLLTNLVKKDITTKYRRSVLGILWSVLNPLLMMLVITAVFQRLFRFDIANFPLYYLTGSLIFNFTSEATIGAMGSLISSAALIKKVYIPKYIFPLEKCLFALVNMAFSMVAVFLVFLILRVPPSWTIILFPIPMLYTFVFCVGFGMILTSLNVFFRDTGHLYTVWITVWLYLTPIIYPIDILPAQVLTVVKLNPLYYYVDYFRQVVLYGQVPGFKMNMICIFFSLTSLLAGLIVFKCKQDKFILYI